MGVKHLLTRAVIWSAFLGGPLGAATMQQVYQNNDFQLTGVSVSKTGRLFVNFPRWSDRYLNAVIEVSPDGSAKPYPNAEWNQWDRKPKTAPTHFVCVQSIVADDAGALWIVDAAAPLLGPTVPGGPKLVKVNLATNQVDRIYPIGPDVAKTDSYLNDIRLDTKRGFGYLTDSGHGGLIVVDLKTGRAHRALDDHPSTHLEPGVRVVVDGKELKQFGKPPQFQADSLALSPDGEYVYYKAITAQKLYRVKTDVLRDSSSSPAKLSAAVETVKTIFPTDGLWMDEHSNIYLSDVTRNAVSRLSPDGQLQSVVQDNRLQWPDTFTEGPDGSIYITASHINEGPDFNEGRSVRTQPYAVFRFKP